MQHSTPQVVTASAESVRAAFAQAEGLLPANAEILGQRVLQTPARTTIEVEAPDAACAKWAARNQGRARFGTTAVEVAAVKLKGRARTGPLHLLSGRNVYEVEIVQTAQVEVVFRLRA